MAKPKRRGRSPEELREMRRKAGIGEFKRKGGSQGSTPTRANAPRGNSERSSGPTMSQLVRSLAAQGKSVGFTHAGPARAEPIEVDNPA